MLLLDEEEIIVVKKIPALVTDAIELISNIFTWTDPGQWFPILAMAIFMAIVLADLTDPRKNDKEKKEKEKEKEREEKERKEKEENDPNKPKKQQELGRYEKMFKEAVDGLGRVVVKIWEDLTGFFKSSPPPPPKKD